MITDETLTKAILGVPGIVAYRIKKALAQGARSKDVSPGSDRLLEIHLLVDPGGFPDGPDTPAGTAVPQEAAARTTG